MAIVPFELNARYNFQLHNSGVYYIDFKNVKVTDYISGVTAEKLGFNVSTLHAQIYPSLPTSAVTEDFRSQNYYIVEYESGKQEIVGEYWVQVPTVEKVSTANVKILLEAVEPEAFAALNEVLAANGYKILSIQREA